MANESTTKKIRTLLGVTTSVLLNTPSGRQMTKERAMSDLMNGSIGMSFGTHLHTPEFAKPRSPAARFCRPQWQRIGFRIVLFILVARQRLPAGGRWNAGAAMGALAPLRPYPPHGQAPLSRVPRCSPSPTR